MSNSSKKQTFLHGAALLTIATIVVKVIGALYKLPLQYIIGDIAYGYFSTVYEIFTLLLLISTAGLPVAMSRMISKASSENDPGQVRRVYNTARTMFLLLGGISTLILAVLCRWLAAAYSIPEAWLAILCLSPCALLMGVISTYRGFFQGQGNMIPTSVSQVLEAVIKLVFGLGFTYVIVELSGASSQVTAGAILGVTMSCAASAIYLFFVFHRSADREVLGSKQPLFHSRSAKELLAIAIPISIGAAGLQALTALESLLYMRQLTGLLESGALATPLVDVLRADVIREAEETGTAALLTESDIRSGIVSGMKGIYGFCLSLYNLPNSLITPITVAIIPAITAQLTLGNRYKAKATTESAARITSLIGLPCAVGLLIMSRPIVALLRGYTGDKLDLAAMLLAILGISTFLHAVVLVTNAVMQAHGHANIPVVNMLASGVVRLVVVYILTGNPAIGIVGVPIGTALCNLCIAVLNIFAIRRTVKEKPALLSNLLRSLLPTAIMAAATYGAYLGLQYLQITSRVVLCGAPIALAVVVYGVCVILFKSITREDCLLLPKGAKIAKLLKL